MRPVGVLRMVDEACTDEKIVAVEISNVYPGYDHIQQLSTTCRGTGWIASATSSSITRTWKPASGPSWTARAGATKRAGC